MDDFKFSRNIVFKQLIIQDGGIIKEELYCKSKITNETRVFRLIKLSRLSIDNFLADIKYLN
jgi:hypothetical protein